MVRDGEGWGWVGGMGLGMLRVVDRRLREVRDGDRESGDGGGDG